MVRTMDICLENLAFRDPAHRKIRGIGFDDIKRWRDHEHGHRVVLLHELKPPFEHVNFLSRTPLMPAAGVPAGPGTPDGPAFIWASAAFIASTRVVYSLPKCDASRGFTAFFAAAPLSARASSSFNCRTCCAISSGEFRTVAAGAPTNNAFRPGRCSVIRIPHSRNFLLLF